MTFKSIAIAAALLTLPLAGGTAFAAQVGGGGGGGGSSDNGGGGVESAVPSSLCVPASTYSLAQALRSAQDGCPKSVTIRIGAIQFN